MSIVCTICQDLVTERPQNLEASDDLIILAMTCGHVFHKFCIGEWFHKVGQNVENGACPCCKTNVSIAQGLRLFPSGDEEGEAMAEKIKNAKRHMQELKNSRGEVDQLNMILEDLGCQLENEKVVHEILRFEHAQKLSEMDELKRQSDELVQRNESQESNWKEVVATITGERDEAQAQLRDLERQFTQEGEERENHYLEKISNLNKKLEMESANMESVKTMMEQTHLNEIKYYQSLTKPRQMVEVGCQTDGRDAALLQARLVSYKSCLLHMQSEVRLLESEYGKLKQLEPVDESFGSLMNDALNKSADVIILDDTHQDFDQVDNSEDNMAMSTGDGDSDARIWVIDQHPSADEKSLSSHANEEFADAPLWAVND